MKNLLSVCTVVASAMLLSACQSSNPSLISNMHNKPVLKSDIYSVQSNIKVGDMYLRPVKDGVHVYGELKGLNPNSSVAVHIHENGRCDDMGKAAGGHFNPYNKPHGNPESYQSHAGDLPNITADENGVAKMDFVKPNISVAMTGTNSVYHRAFIVHAGIDDYVSQPSGNAGDRIACGIIKNLN